MGAPGIPAGIPVASAEVDAAVAEEARDAAQIAVTEAGLDELGVPVQLRETQGHPAPVLVEVSREADLVVVGPSGHGAFVGMPKPPSSRPPLSVGRPRMSRGLLTFCVPGDQP